MNTPETLYNDIIDRIKGNAPVLEDPDRMLKDIMLKIKPLKSIPKQNKIIMILSRTSGIAAAFLLGLLVYEIFFIQDHSPQNNDLQHIEYSSENMHSDLSLQLKNGNFTEKKQIILSIIAQEQQRDKERRTFYANISNYAKTR